MKIKNKNMFLLFFFANIFIILNLSFITVGITILNFKNEPTNFSTEPPEPTFVIYLFKKIGVEKIPIEGAHVYINNDEICIGRYKKTNQFGSAGFTHIPQGEYLIKIKYGSWEKTKSCYYPRSGYNKVEFKLEGKINYSSLIFNLILSRLKEKNIS
jgi:hypothetical protein